MNERQLPADAPDPEPGDFDAELAQLPRAEKAEYAGDPAARLARHLTPEGPEAVRTACCERCGEHFGCGVKNGDCWCMYLPVPETVRREIAGRYRDCLCPTCLRRLAHDGVPDPPTG
jgi:hypothetical protein